MNRTGEADVGGQSRSLADRSRAVLVLVDLQERLVAAMTERDEVLPACSRLARTVALVGAPIVVTRQYPKGLGPTEPNLDEALEGLKTDGATVAQVDKTTFDCCREPVFLGVLRDTGRSQVVMAGMETHICVSQTALELLEAGYDVHVAADACCSRDRRMHEVALDRLRAAGAVVTTSESVMYELVGEAATDEFKALLRIVKG